MQFWSNGPDVQALADANDQTAFPQYVGSDYDAFRLNRFRIYDSSPCNGTGIGPSILDGPYLGYDFDGSPRSSPFDIGAQETDLDH